MLWLMAFICSSAVMAECRPDSALKAVSAADSVTSLAFLAICWTASDIRLIISEVSSRLFSWRSAPAAKSWETSAICSLALPVCSALAVSSWEEAATSTEVWFTS
ncbi:hypothetical protein D3C76_1413430 [compost metagenome]